MSEPLDEGRVIFECILAGNPFKPLPCVVDPSCSRHIGMLPFPGNVVSCYKINCSFPCS